MPKIERLCWDTNFFGYEIGKILVENPNNFDIEKFKTEATSFKLVYVFSKEELSYNGLNLVDRKVVFLQKNILSIKPVQFEREIQSFSKKKHDLEQLINLGLKSGVYSRFNVDPNFLNNEYSKLYREWVMNSIKGKLAFDILVSSQGDEILGFATLSQKNKDLADIGLVAVHEKARGKGIATALINQTVQTAKQQNFKNIQVVTQSNNIPAKKLYTKTNFTPTEKTNIYHYWNL